MSGTGAAGLGYGDLLLTSLLTLGGVCIAAFVIVRLVGRFLATGRSRGTYMLDVVARLPLEPRRSLYVVDVAGKTLLIGTSEMGLSVLSELDREHVRSEPAARHTFAELVRAAWQRRRPSSANRDEPAVSELADAGRTESTEAKPTRASRAEPGRADRAECGGAGVARGDAAESRRAGGAECGGASGDAAESSRAGGAESGGSGGDAAESRRAGGAESGGSGGDAAESRRAGGADLRGASRGEPLTDAGERREEVP